MSARETQSIVLICPYFGEWPGWFPYFIRSCEYNPSIEWRFFTDCEPPDFFPENVKFNQISFSDYSAWISQRLKINFNPPQAYKLCDIKPTYGYLHEDTVAEFDSWGFCDIDLVFGNLRHFLSDDVLNHDVITTHQKRIAGHFSIFRNTETYRTAFMKCSKWRSILEHPEILRFDERIFSNLFVKFKKSPNFVRKIWERTMPLARRIYFKEQYTTPSQKIGWEDGSIDLPTEWYWNRGRLTNNRSRREFIYFHFLRWKKSWGQDIDWSLGDPRSNRWTITVDGFHTSHNVSDKVKLLEP